MFCKQCGRQIPDDSNLCSYCGTEVPKTAPVQYVTYQMPVQEASAPPVIMAPPKKSRYGVWISLIVVAALGTALAMWLLLGDHGGKSTKQEKDKEEKQTVQQETETEKPVKKPENKPEEKQELIPVWCRTESEDGDSAGYTIVMNPDGTIQSEYNDYYKTTYRYDEDENLIEKTYTRIGEYTNITTYTYDKEGRVTEAVTNYDGSSTGNLLYIYDEQGNLIREVAYRDGEQSREISYQYSGENHLYNIRELYYYGDNTQEFQTNYCYDAQGNILEKLVYEYDSAGHEYIMTDYFFYEHDENGRLLRMLSHRIVEGAYEETITENAYERIVKFENCLESVVTYLYNSDGYVIEEKREDQTGGDYNYTYTYDYDAYGNLIQKVCSEDGERFVYNYGWTCYEMSPKQAERLYKEYGHGDTFNFPEEFIKEMEKK